MRGAECSLVRISLAVTLALLLAGALAPAAHAATVAIQTSDSVVYVSVLGGPEHDALTISSPSPGHFTVTQAPGAPLAKGGNKCTVVSPSRVDCVDPDAAGALLMGGDGDDRLEVSGPVGIGAWLFGGNGDDELRAGPGADRLDGGAGADVLRAADGREDTLVCGTEVDAYEADDVDTVEADCEQRVVPTAPVTPPAGPTATPTDPLAAPAPAPLPPAPAPVDFAGGTIVVSHGAVPLEITCVSQVRCEGWITLRLLPRRSRKAIAAASRRPVVSHRRYRVRAGTRKTVVAHLSRRGRQRVLQRRRARCSVRISSVTADGTREATTKRITIKAGGTR